MNKKLTLEEFKEKANKIHNFIYNYNESVFLGTKSKITISCPKHGNFEQLAGNHLRGEGCIKCSFEKISVRCVHNTSIFIEKANKIHNFKYDYSKVSYVKNSIKVTIICKIHGEFEQVPHSHLFLSNGCPKCGGSGVLNNQIFIDRSNKIHDFKYCYDEVIYKNAHTKVIIKCLKHGKYQQLPLHHLKGAGCPKCTYHISKPEIEWLNFLNISNEFRHKTIRINNKNNFIDAFDPSTNTIYEFYGDYWHGNLKIYHENDIHPKKKISFGEVYKKTLDREMKFKNLGYNIISIWESDWKKIKKLSKIDFNLSINPSNYFE